jgi:hypothetical protein
LGYHNLSICFGVQVSHSSTLAVELAPIPMMMMKRRKAR